MKNIHPVVVITIIALVGAGAFIGGMKYQHSKIPNLGGRQFANAPNFVGRNGGGTARATGFRPVNGEIIQRDQSSITVKMMDGSSKIIILSQTTQINKADTVSREELQVGTKVAVFGSDNSDGSVIAQNIQINPVNMLRESASSSALPR